MRWPNSAAVFLLAALVVAPVDAGQRSKWWQEGSVKTNLEISDTQSEAIEEVFGSTIPILRSLADALETEEGELSHLILSMDTAEWELTLQIDKVEAARSALSKKRILMLYHMRQELTPDQRISLQKIQEGQRRQRRSTSRR